MGKKVFTEIGFIRKTQRFKGDVILAVNCGDAEDFLKSKYLFLNMDGSIVPFYIEHFSAEAIGAVIRFEDVNTYEAAAALVSKKVLLPNDELPGGFFKEDELKSLTGFTIVDRKQGIVGSVKDIAETPGQLMLFFDYGGTEVMLPVNDKTLLKIVKKKKEIHVNIPAGLLEVYTGGKNK
jgi:16S rRNA processing protein RimM